MRTRVIREWHEADWLYKVEIWTEVTGDEQWINLAHPWSQAKNEPAPIPNPKKGDWYWRRYIIPNYGAPGTCWFSRDRALTIAQRLADGLSLEAADIVAEFGA